MTKPQRRDMDGSMAIRAAWLHYAAGLTQAEVATRLGISTVKANRLIARANQSGAVRVSIDSDAAQCVSLETRIANRFGLDLCEVTPDSRETGLPLRALSGCGAAFLEREFERLAGGVIGVGHGRTLSAVIEALPRRQTPPLRFVALMGGLTSNYAANPHDVIHRLAEKTGMPGYVIPLPFIANSTHDRAILLSQNGVSDVMAMATRADLMVVGIGTVGDDSQLAESRMIDATDLRDMQAQGAVAEMLGIFFDSQGHVIRSSVAERTIAPNAGDLAGRRIVAIAGGPAKAAAICAVLQSGLLSGLITDERTALSIVAWQDAAPKSGGQG